MLSCVVIGVGQRGMGYIKYLNLKPLKSIKIVGIMETNFTFRARALQKFPHLKVFETCNDILSCETVNCVFVCTQDVFHVSVFRELFESPRYRGLAIVLEKPVTTNSLDLQYMKDVFTTLVQKNTTIHVPFVLRFTEIFRALKKAIVNPKQVMQINVELNLSNAHSSSFFRRQHTHEFIQTKVCHDVDLLSFLMRDEITSVRVERGHTIPPKPKNAKPNCSKCPELPTCPMGFHPKKNNFVVVCDIEDLNDADKCGFDYPPIPTFYMVICTFKHRKIVAYVTVNMFSKTPNRIVSVVSPGEVMSCNYQKKTITKNENIVYKFEKRSIGHQNGDLRFLKRMAENYTAKTHTLLKEGIQTSEVLINV